MENYLVIDFDPVLHEYRANGVRKPPVTWILAKSGLCDFSFVEEEIRERAMARGKSVHWMLELEDQGRLNYRTVPKMLRPYRKVWNEFKKNTGFVPILIEHRFVSSFGYAGTFDRYGEFPPTAIYLRGSHALIDIKTGSVQEWTKYQLAPYAVAKARTVQAAKTIRRIGVALTPDGYKVKEFPASSLEHDFSVFMEGLRRTECLIQQ